jgi:hypothetical protein
LVYAYQHGVFSFFCFPMCCHWHKCVIIIITRISRESFAPL